MTEDTGNHIARVEVIPAAIEDEPILANLLQLYAHDFSEFYDVEIEPDGRFVYRQLPRYWSESGRHPFLVRVDGKLAGFVLIKRGSEISGNAAVWDVAEFFVLRAYRRHGVGTRAAHEIWRRFPGAWEVRVLRANISAHQFWTLSIGEFAGENMQLQSVEKDGDEWTVFAFASRGNNS
jgi:predicted acetyltransferase